MLGPVACEPLQRAVNAKMRHAGILPLQANTASPASDWWATERLRPLRRARQAGSGPLVRGQVLVPVAERLEGAPEPLLRALLVQRFVDVRRVQSVDRGREGLHVAL